MKIETLINCVFGFAWLIFVICIAAILVICCTPERPDDQ